MQGSRVGFGQAVRAFAQGRAAEGREVLVTLRDPGQAVVAWQDPIGHEGLQVLRAPCDLVPGRS